MQRASNAFKLAWQAARENIWMSQVYGPESSGKTTLALHAMAEVQKSGGTAALIDAEHAFDSEYSKVRAALLISSQAHAGRAA